MAIEINNEEPQGEIVQEPDPNSENSEVYIIQEDTTKRGEFEKHYICSDGTYVVTTYAEAIHYKDDNGKWVDVDNRPMETTEGKYTTRNGDFGISVPSSAGDGHLMRMDKGEHSLSWTLSANKKAGTIKMDSNVSTMAQKPVQSQKMQVGTTKRPEIIISNSEQPHENHKVLRDEATFDLPNVSSKVRYDDLFGTGEGISVVYTTYRNKIEEDIYIEKPTDITSFSMEVAAPELTARLNSDNSVDFLDNDGKVCYHVGIPYMMDADFAVLNDIETAVNHSGDTWVITYTPDAEWFTSEKRVYPILLDPSITTNEYRTNIQDTYVEEGDSTVHSSEQLLYINGGTGNRKAVIRFVNLPAIDETMPLISAKINFTAQYAPFSDVSLTLDYITGNRSTSISAYTYDDASKAADYSTGYILSPGLTGVSFNLTNYIYDILEGTGDFVLGYSADGDTTFCYPFHSAESTTGTGPVLTITYGYSLPDGVADGAILALQNYGSTLFASVSGTDPAEYANVYQVERDDWIPTTNELFRLQYNTETGAYRLYSMASNSGTNRMLTVYTTSTGLIYGSKNVRLEDLDDNPEISQDWMIVSHDGSTFRLLPRSNMSVCLTANGDTEGTSSGAGTGTTGNVCVKTVDTNSDYQLWWLVKNEVDDNGNPLIYTSKYAPATLENGVYYFINDYSGRYLYLNRTAAMSTRGVITDTRTNDNVSNTSETSYQVYRGYITWRITNLGDGYCTIQNPISMNYLYDNNLGSSVRIGNMDDSIPDKFKWRIYYDRERGWLFQNKNSKLFLSVNEIQDETSNIDPLTNRNADVLTKNLYAATSTESGKQTWRIFKQENYAEPIGRFTLSISAIDIGEPKMPSVYEEISSSLDESSDFYYIDIFANHLETPASCVSFDHVNGTICGVASGSTTLIATHKTTGLSYPFVVKVNKNAIIIVPGFLGSELFIGDNNPYFKKHMPLFSSELMSKLSTYEYGDTLQDILPNDYDNFLKETDWVSLANFYNAWMDSMSCNDDGTSKYDLYVKEYRSEDESTRNNNYCGTGDAYNNLYSELASAYSNEYFIDLFSYDWRLSNLTNASKLDEYIKRYNYDNVVLIAHSLGGLVTSGYLGLGASQRAKVKQVFFLSCPLIGVPAVANIWFNEDISFVEEAIAEEIGIPLENFQWVYETITATLHPIRNLISNYVSVYEAFPSEYYFQLTESSYMTYECNKIMLGGTTTITECSTYSATRDNLTTWFASFDSSLMSKAESFHDTTFITANHVSYYVDSYFYYCTNELANTDSHVYLSTMLSGDTCSSSLEVDDFDVGDGLVLNTSASLADIYPPKSKDYSGDHMSLVNDKTIIKDWIENISHLLEAEGS